MLLSDFLKTVPELTPLEKRDAAKAHPVKTGYIIPATTFTSLLQGFRLTGLVKRIANDPAHPAHDDMVAIEYALNGNQPFSFIEGSVAGDGAIMTMNRLIETDLTEYAVPLTQLLQTVTYLANPVTYPLAKTTLYDVLTTENACPTAAVSKVGAYLAFTLNDVVEEHSARLWGVNPRTNRLTVLGNIRLSDAGAYEFKLPTHYLDFTDYAIDDAYGVI